jgi:hypothetical protein
MKAQAQCGCVKVSKNKVAVNAENGLGMFPLFDYHDSIALCLRWFEAFHLVRVFQGYGLTVVFAFWV